MASLALALILTFIVVFEIIDRCNARDSYGARYLCKGREDYRLAHRREARKAREAAKRR